jgi:4-amino-4-deoxy-L-arabinose transferase-like glycosyltransferase
LTPGPGITRRRALIGFQLALALILVLWFVVVARRTYNFADPAALAIFHDDRHFYRDLLTRLPRNLDLLGLTLVFTGSAVGVGGLALRPLRVPWHDEWEHALFALAVGLVLYTYAVMALGWAGLFVPWAFIALLAVGVGLTILHIVTSVRRWQSRSVDRSGGPHRSRLRLASIVVLSGGLCVGCYLGLLGALGPEAQFDARWNHLAVPVHYLAHGGFFPIVQVTRMAVTGLSPYQEMLYVPLVGMGGPIAGKLLHWMDAILAALALIYFAVTHFRSAQLGLIASLIFVTTPLVAWSMSTGGTDLPAAFFTLLAMHGFLRWRQTQEGRYLVLSAVVTGYLIGVKPFAGITLLLLVLGIVVASLSRPLSRRALAAAAPAIARRAAVVGLIATACCVPWFIRSYQLTGDPVFPTLSGIFPSPYWGPAADHYVTIAYLAYGHQHTLLNLLRLPWDTVVHPYQYRSVVGPWLLVGLPLLAIAMVAAREIDRKLIRLLVAFCALWVVMWYATGAVELRYLDSVLPMIALLVAYAVMVGFWDGWSAWVLRGAALALTPVIITLNSQLLVEFQTVSNKQSIAGRASIPWAYLYRGAPVGSFPPPPIVDFWNAHLSPATDKVSVDKFYVSYYLDSKPEIFNGDGFDSPAGLGQWRLTDRDAIEHLRTEHVTYLEVYPLDIARILAAPLGRDLLLVYRDPSDGRELFQLRGP